MKTDIKPDPRFLKVYSDMVNNVDDWRMRDDYEYAVKECDFLSSSYDINCTGDVCKGDEIVFVKRIWKRRRINRYGKMANIVTGYELVQGTVEKESYGREKGQHTFTIRLKDGSSLRIKGRNLYGVGVWRKPWKDEEERQEILDEKHERGSTVRAKKELQW